MKKIIKRLIVLGMAGYLLYLSHQDTGSLATTMMLSMLYVIVELEAWYTLCVQDKQIKENMKEISRVWGPGYKIKDYISSRWRR